VLAAVLAGDPLARAVYRELTAGVTVSDAEVRRYFAANPDRYRPRPARLVTHWYDGRPVNGGRPYLLAAGDLAGPVDRAVFAARDGATVGPIECHTFVAGPLLRHEVTFTHAAPAIKARLLDARRLRHFAIWAGDRCAQAVLMPGFEHPGDIRHPDHTHRH
jgi:[acyl-carrier-protein] S-malonyltransferase